MTTELSTSVYGESVSDLLPGLLAIGRSMKRDAGGTYRSMVMLEPNEGAPLQRALLRVEADLLREEAAAIGLGASDNRGRSRGERSADALVRLVQAVGAASRMT